MEYYILAYSLTVGSEVFNGSVCRAAGDVEGLIAETAGSITEHYGKMLPGAGPIEVVFLKARRISMVQYLSLSSLSHDATS